MSNEEQHDETVDPDEVIDAGDPEVIDSIAMTPGLTPEEIKTLGETATILRDNFDIKELKRVSEDREQLPQCKAKRYRGEGATHDRPIIMINDHVEDRIDAASDVMLIDNLNKLSKPGFVKGVIYRGTSKGELKTVAKTDGAEEYSIDVIGAKGLSYMLSSAICWMGSKGQHAKVPTDVRDQLTAFHLWYPVLKTLSAAPRWSREGDRFNVAHLIGYDQTTASFITKKFDIKRKAKPTKAEVDKAVAFLMGVLEEFPFADDASKTNALALAITMALRNTWTTAPGFIVTAQAPESGKTLLVETLNALVYGGPWLMPNKMAYKEGDQDRRNLTALFRDVEGDVVWWDEPRLSSDSTEMGSPTLNLVLTAASGSYRDRPVYSKETVVLNVQKTLVISGNNLPLNPELARRSVVISLRKDGTEVYTRNEDELREYARDNQATFHQALATIIDHWQASGSPKSAVRFGSYNSWMQVVGGIFDLLGITGLRTNTETFVSPYNYAKADFALWVMKNVPSIITHDDGSIEITYIEIERAMRDATKQKALDPLMRQLYRDAPDKDADKVWSEMLDVVSGVRKSKIPQLVSRAFKRIMVFDSIQSRDGRTVVWMRHLNRKAGVAGARVRFSKTTKTDRRRGTGANQHTAKTPPRP